MPLATLAAIVLFAPPPPAPEAVEAPEPTQAELAADRLEPTVPQSRATDRRARWLAYHEGPQRSGTVVVGTGFGAFVSPTLRLNGGAWSARAYQNWFLRDAKFQLSLGSGVNGIHAAGLVYPDPYDTFADPNPVRVTAHEITVPVEFRFGGPYPDRVFVYGLVGGSLGFVTGVDSYGNSAIGFGYHPVVLGLGGYAALGKSNFILGAEARSNFVESLFLDVATNFDLQIKFGFNFR